MPSSRHFCTRSGGAWRSKKRTTDARNSLISSSSIKVGSDADSTDITHLNNVWIGLMGSCGAGSGVQARPGRLNGIVGLKAEEGRQVLDTDIVVFHKGGLGWQLVVLLQQLRQAAHNHRRLVKCKGQMPVEVLRLAAAESFPQGQHLVVVAKSGQTGNIPRHRV